MATMNELIPAFNAFTQTALSIADRRRQELKEIELKQKEIEGFEFVSKLAESFEGKKYQDFGSLEQDFTSAMKTIYATKNPIAIQNGLATLNAMYQQKSNYIKEEQERRLGEADLGALNLIYGGRGMDNPNTPELDEDYSITNLMNLPEFANLTPAQKAKAVGNIAPNLVIQNQTTALPDTTGGIVVTKKKYSKLAPDGKFQTEKYVIKNGKMMSLDDKGELTLADESKITPEISKAFLEADEIKKRDIEAKANRDYRYAMMGQQKEANVNTLISNMRSLYEDASKEAADIISNNFDNDYILKRTARQILGIPTDSNTAKDYPLKLSISEETGDVEILYDDEKTGQQKVVSIYDARTKSINENFLKRATDAYAYDEEYRSKRNIEGVLPSSNSLVELERTLNEIKARSEEIINNQAAIAFNQQNRKLGSNQTTTKTETGRNFPLSFD